ncbi:hypothetical protein BH20BAC1_BH20BAC1_01680 [soil metagenome]
MKKLLLYISLLFPCTQYSYAQHAGDLDNTFGTNGVVKTDFGSNFNLGGNPKKVLPQSDGSMLIVFDFEFERTAILKKHADGSDDLHFGINGLSEVAGMKTNAAAAQADGSIIVVGSVGNSFAVARYHPGGTLDKQFGTSGIQLYQLGDQSQGNDVTLQQDGKMVILGISGTLECDGLYTNFALVRLQIILTIKHET